MNDFRKGLIDALPVFAGYFCVSFTFGIAASTSWRSGAIPVLTSMLHLSGTGQFVLVSLIDAGSSAAAIVAGIVAINLRYTPMALAVSQRLAPGTPVWKRLAIAVADTDEIVAISLRHAVPIPFPYVMGLLACSWVGWVGGTILGANPATRALLPPGLVAAFGVAFPAMFAAIVFPEVRASRRTRMAVVAAACGSLVLRALPLSVDPGWIILASGIAAALAAALLFPGAAGKSAGRPSRDTQGEAAE